MGPTTLWIAKQTTIFKYSNQTTLNYFLGSKGILVILEDFGGHFGHFEHLGAF